MKESNGRLVRKIALWTGLAIVSVAAVGIGWGALKLAAFFSFMRAADEPVYAQIRFLEDPKVAEAVAQKLARFCQSLDTGKDIEASELSRIVPELSGTNEISYGMVTTNSAYLEMGGGFWHFGYKLDLDVQNSTSATNIWVLTLYSERSSDKKLVRVPLSAGQRLDTNEVNMQQSRTTN
jgi:hypothetical protein